MTLGRQLAIELLILVAISLALGFLGPFGTYAMPTGIRLIYWVGFGFIGYLFFRPINIVAEWLCELSNMPLWAGIIMSTAVATFPLTILIAFAIGGMEWTNPFLLNGFGLLYLQVAVIGIAIYLLMGLIFPRDARGGRQAEASDQVVQTAEKATAPACRLMDRLPIGFIGPIIALQSEDHYVRVHSKDHSEMLLMRLSDAIAEMDGVEGLQTHRSWWVASNAVQRAIRDGRNVSLLLDNGEKVPVSRGNMASVRAAGFL